MDLKSKLIKFMYGRYGADALSLFIWSISLIMSFVCIFIPVTAVNWIIRVASTLLLILVFFRMFSKNISARRSENAKFLKLKKPLSSFFKLTFNRIKYRKTHIYRRCPHCKNMLRLPKVKGEHNVSCPACKKVFKVKI